MSGKLTVLPSFPVGFSMPAPGTALQNLAQEAARCAKCGACTAVCPIYRLTGRESLASRGRLHLLTKLLENTEPSPLLAEILSQCLLCGACADACPRGIDLPALVIKARHALGMKAGESGALRRAIRSVLASPLLLGGAGAATRGMADSLLALLPESSGLRLRLAGLRGAPPSGHLPPAPPLSEEDPVMPAAMLFAGCFALHMERSIIDATRFLVGKTHGAGLSLPKAQCCCGLAAASSGDLETARGLAEKNIAAFRDSDAPILASCASCFSHLVRYPDLFPDDVRLREEAVAFAARVREFSAFLAAAPRGFSFPAPPPCSPSLRVSYHDPCHLRFRHRITAPPRRLLASLPATELMELPGGARCCGQGGLFHIAHPGLARGLRQEYRAALDTLRPDVMVTTCTGCLLGLREGLGDSEKAPAILHLASYLTGKMHPSL